MPPQIQFQRLRPAASLPARVAPTDDGWDLRATGPVTLGAGRWTVARVSVGNPGQALPGMKGRAVAQSPGVPGLVVHVGLIEPEGSGDRTEIVAVLSNPGREPISIPAGGSLARLARI